MKIESGKVYLNGIGERIRISKALGDSHWKGYAVDSGEYRGFYSGNGTWFEGKGIDDAIWNLVAESPKTIAEIVKEYDAAYVRSREEHEQWRKSSARPANIGGPRLPAPTPEPYNGYSIDYKYFETALFDSIKVQFNLTDKQTGYIMGEAYERYHSGYSDIFWGAHGIAEFVTKFPKD